MSNARRVKHPGGTKPSTEVAELAAWQRGIVTTEEMLARGSSRRQIVRWVRDGHLHQKYRGVYAVGHREISVEARWLAAVKACGEESALSYFAAGAHTCNSSRRKRLREREAGT
jgi:hypothetical protein